MRFSLYPARVACHRVTGGRQSAQSRFDHHADNHLASSIDDDDEIVAHLLPCGHDLHNACLKPWVERANSCPICRAKFNSVELRQAIGGTVIDSYAVQDKVQEAEIDPSMIMEDELFSMEVWEPCLVCQSPDNAHSQMFCDGCDKAVHIFCAGYDEAPEVWYCGTCLMDTEGDISRPGLPAAVRRRPRRQHNATAGRRLGGQEDTSWARVWQSVSRRLDIDLDFPFDDEPARDTRTPQQRREFQQWQRRFEVADRQGVTNRLRDIASQSRPSQTAPAPESQEELRAWNAFDKARELHEPNNRKRKATASPASPQEPEPEPRKLKRPRLRRPAANAGSPPAESSHTAAQRGMAEGTTFLSSLLREVENNASSAGSPGPSSPQYSPRNSSPARSPGSSGYGSPHAYSVTPPMSPTGHPNSPHTPLFSPFSPAVASQDQESTARPRPRPRGRRRDHHDSGYDENYHSGGDALSPSRNISYSAKEEIQRMVKLALKPRYVDKTINKDQYTDINRDISRKMYDLVGDASALADSGARERWQEIAADEVQKAITSLAAQAAKSV